MEYINSFATSLLTTAFYLFLIGTAGYLIGGIQIKGISLGNAGILLAALLFGILASFVPYITLEERKSFFICPQPGVGRRKKPVFIISVRMLVAVL